MTDDSSLRLRRPPQAPLPFPLVRLISVMPIPFIQVVSKRGWGVDRVIVV